MSFILRVLGVDGIVSGSYLVNHDNIGVAYIQLTSKNTPSHFLVEDFMIPISELPIIHEDNSSLEQLLRLNEDFKMGCTLVVNQNKHLVGLSTNADIRRGLLKNKLTIHDSPITDFVNKNPLVVNAKNTIKEMLEIIKSVPFPVLLLPVIEKDRTLKGIVMFNNLIKGE